MNYTQPLYWTAVYEWLKLDTGKTSLVTIKESTHKKDGIPGIPTPPHRLGVNQCKSVKPLKPFISSTCKMPNMTPEIILNLQLFLNKKQCYV